MTIDELLYQLKEKYGNVYAALIGDQTFFFRELTRKEYRLLTSLPYANEYELEEAICQTAVVYPEGYDFSVHGRAGVVKTLSVQILVASGFANPGQTVEMLEQHRQSMQQFESQAETLVSLVFHIRHEEMADWTQDQFLQYVARAEWVMQNIWKLDYAFMEQKEEGEEKAQPTLEEMAAEIREAGGDPMIELRHLIVHKKDKDYVPFPLIAGTKLLENEEVLHRVREQIQGLPNRRQNIL